MDLLERCWYTGVCTVALVLLLVSMYIIYCEKDVPRSNYHQHRYSHEHDIGVDHGN